MNKKISSLITCMFTLMAGLISQAAIVGYTNDFSSNITGWTNRLGTPGVSRLTTGNALNDYNDGDTNQFLAYTVGMVCPGDGVRGDGSLMMDVKDATSRNEAIGYTLSGTLELGETITFSATLVPLVIYTAGYLQLWDATRNGAMTNSSYNAYGIAYTMSGVSTSSPAGAPIAASISYTAQAADVGHTVQIRFLDFASATTRDLVIDNVTVVSVMPAEPAKLSLLTITAQGL